MCVLIEYGNRFCFILSHISFYYIQRLQCHVRPWSFCPKCRLHLNTHILSTPWSRSGLTMPPSTHSVGTYPEASSHATWQGLFSHSCISSLSHCGLIDLGTKSWNIVRKLISTSIFYFFLVWIKRSVQVGNEWSNILTKSWQAGKKPPPLPHTPSLVAMLSIMVQKTKDKGLTKTQLSLPRSLRLCPWPQQSSIYTHTPFYDVPSN